MARSRPPSGCAETSFRLVWHDGNGNSQLRKTGRAIGGSLLASLLTGLVSIAPAAAADVSPAHDPGVLGASRPTTRFNFNHPPREERNDAELTIAKTTPERPERGDQRTVAEGESTSEKAALTPGPALDPALSDAGAAGALYLEVLINGQPKHLIAEFIPLAGGGFASKAKELKDLGIVVPEGAADDDLISLADLGAEWRYDEAAQSIDIWLPAERLRRKRYSLSGQPEKPEVTQGGSGFVLNYDIFAAGHSEGKFAQSAFDGISAQLDGWVYSPFGTVFSAGLVKIGAHGESAHVRLDSHWTFVDAERIVQYRVGDLVTAGPGWARSVRLGGVQIRRSFRLRPDIIATPLPKLSATAAVPTAIDVYVNNLKVHSGEVAPGPFEITNIPAISHSGVARLVMHTAGGRTIVREQRFYVSPRLLRAGLAEFSFAAGVPRNGFGSRSFDYDRRYPVAAGSFRYGLADRLTLEGHAEAGRDLALGGVGTTFSLFERALVSLSVAASRGPKGEGLLTHALFETSIGGLVINASSLRTFGHFTDIAARAAARAASRDAGTAILTAAGFPKALESLNVGYAIAGSETSFAASFVHATPADGETTNTLNLGFNQGLWGQASLYATAVLDLKHPREPSLFVGLNVPLGGGGGVSVGGSYDAGGQYRVTASYNKPLKEKDNAVGWRARVTYGDLKSVQASLAWRAPAATFRASAMKIGEDTLAQASARGAIVVADHAVFASQRIHDAFAVVNAGAAGVKVRYENRLVGKTRKDGRLLLTSLRSLERNKISIDAETLPVDAVIEHDTSYVVPAWRHGVVVDFHAKRTTHAALVILHDAHGKPLPPGSEVKVEGVKETFVVGYDGEAWLDGLGRRNRLRVNTGEGTCEAAFSFTPGKEVQPVIGPLTCR